MSDQEFEFAPILSVENPPATPAPRVKCRATNSKGEPCGAWAMREGPTAGELCPAHSGLTTTNLDPKKAAAASHAARAEKKKSVTDVAQEEREAIIRDFATWTSQDRRELYQAAKTQAIKDGDWKMLQWLVSLFLPKLPTEQVITQTTITDENVDVTEMTPEERRAYRQALIERHKAARGDSE